MQGSTHSLVNPLKRMQRKEELEKEFVESGERDRIEEIVGRRLQESGWARHVEDMCKEYIAKKVGTAPEIPSNGLKILVFFRHLLHFEKI